MKFLTFLLFYEDLWYRIVLWISDCSLNFGYLNYFQEFILEVILIIYKTKFFMKFLTFLHFSEDLCNWIIFGIINWN